METKQIDIFIEHEELIKVLAKFMESDKAEVHYCMMEIAIAVLKILNEPDETIGKIFYEIKKNPSTMEMAGLVNKWLKINDW